MQKYQVQKYEINDYAKFYVIYFFKGVREEYFTQLLQ